MKTLLALPVSLLLLACAQAPVPQQSAPTARVRVTPPPSGLPTAQDADVRERTLQSKILENGLRIFHLPQTKAGLARVQLVLDGGLVEAGPDRRRQIALLNETGSEASHRAWQERLTTQILSASAWASRHNSVLELIGPVERLAEMHQTVLAWAATPLWSDSSRRQADLDLAINTLMEGFGSSDATRLWARLAYGAQHPYGRPPTVSDTGLADLHQRWRSALQPGRAALLISAPDAALGALPAPNWPLAVDAAAALPTHPSLPEADEGLTIHLLHTSQAPQISVRVGDVWAPPAAGADALKEQVLLDASADLLGGGVGGRLWADLREVHGLAYSLGARAEKAPLAHGLVLQASGAPEKSAALLQGLLAHRRLLAEAPADAVEMAIVQAQQASRRALRLDNDASQLAWLAERWRSGRSDADTELANQFAGQLNPETLQAFARQRFSNAPVIVVRGDAGQLQDGLQKAFPGVRITRH